MAEVSLWTDPRDRMSFVSLHAGGCHKVNGLDETLRVMELSELVLQALKG